jgi:hypothetical protein
LAIVDLRQSQIKKLLAEHLDPSAFPVPKALFFTPLRSVQHALPCTLEVPPLGFGYPFDGVSSLRTLEATFSASNAPGLLPSKLFSNDMIE